MLFEREDFGKEILHSVADCRRKTEMFLMQNNRIFPRFGKIRSIIGVHMS